MLLVSDPQPKFLQSFPLEIDLSTGSVNFPATAVFLCWEIFPAEIRGRILAGPLDEIGGVRFRAKRSFRSHQLLMMCVF